MIELNLSILENLPEAAVYVVLGRITAINPMAAHYLPSWRSTDRCPVIWTCPVWP